MKLFHKVVLVLSVAFSAPLLPFGHTTASAQPTDATFAMPGFLEIVSAGEVVGNGQNTVKLHVLALKNPLRNL